MNLSPKSLRAIHDVLAEIYFTLSCVNSLDSDPETKKWMQYTHSLARDIVEVTTTEE
tara:strand:+ start:632 stop:802 length:171 start_codon:yes stop_codon:yes gene_type:complete